MNRLNSYWLRKKENNELSTSARLYRNSMRPEEQLDEMYEVMQNVGLGEESDPDDLSTLFADFSNDEKMYPSMMKPERRKLWDQRKQQMEQIQERQKNAKRQLHAQFMVINPELPLAKELRKTEYGQGLMAEMATSQPRKPETGTGQTIIDEQKRDSINMEPVQQFETKPFTVPDMDEPFSLLATERDKNGRIIKKALALAPQPILREYEYDNNGRLSKVLCEGSIIEQYHYGKYGERLLSETRQLKQTLYKYNDSLQVIEAGETKYYYDNQGRIIEKINLGNRTHYSYLESGPLHEVLLPDGRRIEYTCDAAGRRITKSINGKVVEKYLWQDLTTLVAVTDGEGLHPKIFVYDDEGGPVAMTYEGSTFFFAADQVDSIFMVADEQGNEVKRIIYDSFGNLLFDSNEKFDTYIGFATGLTDKDTGLIHFGHREYDPAIGRFITPDPIGFAGGDVDVYGYCLDDPINFYDRTGLEGKSEEKEGGKILDGISNSDSRNGNSHKSYTNGKVEKKEINNKTNSTNKSYKDSKIDSNDKVKSKNKKAYSLGIGVNAAGFGFEVGAGGELVYRDPKHAAFLVNGKIGASNGYGAEINLSATEHNADSIKALEGSSHYVSGGVVLPGGQFTTSHTKSSSKTSNSSSINLGIGEKINEYLIPQTSTGKSYSKTILKFDPPLDDYADYIDKKVDEHLKEKKKKVKTYPRHKVEW